MRMRSTDGSRARTSFAPTPSGTSSIPSSRCSGPSSSHPSLSDSRRAKLDDLFASGVNGRRSSPMSPPRPTASITAACVPSSVEPKVLERDCHPGLAQEAEQEMLRVEHLVAEPLRLLLRVDHDLARPRAEVLEFRPAPHAPPEGRQVRLRRAARQHRLQDDDRLASDRAPVLLRRHAQLLVELVGNVADVEAGHCMHNASVMHAA